MFAAVTPQSALFTSGTVQQFWLCISHDVPSIRGILAIAGVPVLVSDWMMAGCSTAVSTEVLAVVFPSLTKNEAC